MELSNIALSFSTNFIQSKDPESDFGKWLKTFLGLSYLDSSDVAVCFAFDILSDAPDDEKAMEFVDYILNTYVDDNARFSSPILADPNLDNQENDEWL